MVLKSVVRDHFLLLLGILSDEDCSVVRDTLW